MNNSTTGTVSVSTCPHCGACREVRAVEYYPDGRVKRVEYERGQGKPALRLPSIASRMTLPREAPAAMVRASKLNELLNQAARSS